jgi:peptide/nickel transport system ATP-binding protein
MSNLVEIRDLNIRFTGERTVHAVNDISLSLGEGEVLVLIRLRRRDLRALMAVAGNGRRFRDCKVLGRDVLAMNERFPVVNRPDLPGPRWLGASTRSATRSRA